VHQATWLQQRQLVGLALCWPNWVKLQALVMLMQQQMRSRQLLLLKLTGQRGLCSRRWHGLVRLRTLRI
jgi:hypothetical protein